MSGREARYESILEQMGFAGGVRAPGVVFATDRSLRCVYHNDEWRRFAQINGAADDFDREWGLGRNILDGTTGPLRIYYASVFLSALERGRVWERAIECSSARRFRALRMQVVPLLDRSGLLVINAPLVDRLHDPAARRERPPHEPSYRGDDGLIYQCGHCRRIRRAGSHDRWDWVPRFIERLPADSSQDLCGICREYFFPAS